MVAGVIFAIVCGLCVGKLEWNFEEYGRQSAITRAVCDAYCRDTYGVGRPVRVWNVDGRVLPDLGGYR
jgi:hypothetical protein